MNVAELFVKCLEAEGSRVCLWCAGGGKRPLHDGVGGLFNTVYSDPP